MLDLLQMMASGLKANLSRDKNITGDSQGDLAGE
jgi:hypothetical protein